MTDHDLTQSDLVADQLARIEKAIDRLTAELSAISYALGQNRTPPVYDFSDPGPVTPDRR